MGCDIHLHTEVKINGEWHHYSAPSVDRQYMLFAKMAGVRNSYDIEPLALPRGIPDNATFITKFDSDRWGGDGHSHSYLTAPEIHELVLWLKNQVKYFMLHPCWEGDTFGYVFGNHFSDFTKYPVDNPEGLEDIRFVFWFDN